ncbi:MAG: GDSL-type esterase/lipase family protein [Chloroflexi bacterium]|nr:GDSL-type esterase/lipase family protein [Chloroflexota bacterium]
MPQHIAASDPRLRWSGVISTEVTDGWVMPWRIPVKEKNLFAVELVERAAMPAGVRLSFASNSSWLEGFCDSIPERSPIDLHINGEYFGSAKTEERTSFRFDGLGAESKLFDLWLPQFGEFRVRGLNVDDGADLTEAVKETKPRWITYGSSITHCRAADSPTTTWPSIVARTRGYDLTCLGFGGQCHLDPMIARVIRDREADLISMCLGINIYGAASLSPRTFGPGILGFVKIVREKHPGTPIVLMSPIFSPGREDTLNPVGFTLREMGAEVEKAVETLRANGDENIHYIDGLDVFSAEHTHLLPDDLHPNDEGYGVMASNLLRLLPEV